MKDRFRKYGLTILMAWVLLGSAVFIIFPRDANALFFCPCNCGNCGTVITENVISSVTNTLFHILWREEVFGTANPIPDGEGLLGLYQEWLREEFFGERLAPALKMMTEQLTTISMRHMMSIGMLFDAKTAIETQRLYQELMAQAHKDYHPSTGMCVFGTNVRSLAASDFTGTYVHNTLTQRFLSRQLGYEYSNALLGPETDMRSGGGESFGRVGQFSNYFCDPKDWNHIRFISADGSDFVREDTGLHFCATIPDPDDNAQTLPLPVYEGTVNSDIDFTKTVMTPRVIDFDLAYPDGSIDFQSADITYSSSTVNRSIVEMSNNLYGHRVFSREFSDSTLDSPGNYDEYIDVRAVTAKRSVAQNTFNALVALKVRGTDENSPFPGNSQDTAQYMNVILNELGISPEDIPEYLLGGRSQRTLDEESNVRPAAAVPSSYYAQMELLAKRIYQMPAFYTNLYDTPANIKRKGVAMQAIGLMLDRDIYDSFLRSEMLLSQLLEARLYTLQKEVESDLANLDNKGVKD